MTTKTDFTDPEWQSLVRAPMVAGMALTLADPGGSIEALKESTAVLKLVSQDLTDTGLRGEVARDLVEQVQQHQMQLKDFEPHGAEAKAEIVDELASVGETVGARATREDAESFRAWLLECARRAADAAKEGGFMGFKAERVSAGEQRMLEEIEAALSS